MRRLWWIVALALASACSRSGLELVDGELVASDPDAAGVVDPNLPDGALPSVCVPSEEVCNGKDDDCDGKVDEVPPIPCEGGGAQYCVSGAFSLCPDRCEVCMPGSERVCFISYCKFWGSQTCAADGKGWGKCREDDPPSECKAVADEEKYSKALEQCCLDAGYCCVDTFDLDGDGDSKEMIGACDEVQCKP